MRKILSLLFLFIASICLSQDMEDDLFQTWSSNSMSSFLSSSFKKMTVTTNRMIKGEVTTELVTTYKRSKFNPKKVNFSITYTDQYIVEERKKSNGRYLINENGKIHKYERTDIGLKNKMTGTIYHTYLYKNGVVLYDKMRVKEYVNVGAVEMDTIVTLDSLVYSVYDRNDTIHQVDELSKDTRAFYIVKNNQLMEKGNFINGYSENLRYTYNSAGRLEMIVYSLKSAEGNTGRNVLKIKYNSSGQSVKRNTTISPML